MTFLEQCALLSANQAKHNAIQSILNEEDDMPELSALEKLIAAISKHGAVFPDRESYNAFLEEVGGM